MIETGDLIFAQVRGRLHGQRTLTTFWYYANQDVPGIEEADVAAQFCFDWIVSNEDFYSLPLSEEVTDLQVRAQLVRPNGTIRPIRWAFFDQDFTVPEGQVAESALPSSVCAVVRRRTALAGRKYRGRVYAPGVPFSFEDDSQLTQVGYNALTTNWGSMLITPVTSLAVDWKPCVTDAPLHSRITEVTSASVDPILRVQRRREIAVGE